MPRGKAANYHNAKDDVYKDTCACYASSLTQWPGLLNSMLSSH